MYKKEQRNENGRRLFGLETSYRLKTEGGKHPETLPYLHNSLKKRQHDIKLVCARFHCCISNSDSLYTMDVKEWDILSANMSK